MSKVHHLLYTSSQHLFVGSNSEFNAVVAMISNWCGDCNVANKWQATWQMYWKIDIGIQLYAYLVYRTKRRDSNKAKWDLERSIQERDEASIGIDEKIW